jgi:hypothetical protein
MYAQLREEGLNLGVTPSFYPEKRSFSNIEIAIAHCKRLQSSIVAVRESNRLYDLENQEIKSFPIKEQSPMSRPVKYKFPGNAIITVLVDSNPKKRTAAERFDLYRSGMTVQELLDISHNQTQAMNDIIWDLGKGWIKVEAPIEYSEAV